MSITVKQIVTRPSLHDLYLFELFYFGEFDGDKVANSFSKFYSYTLNWHHFQCNHKELIPQAHNLRPDIVQILESEPTTLDKFYYNPCSTTHEVVSIFETLEIFRNADQELFNSVNSILIELAKKTNNTFREEVYDNDGNLIEMGLLVG
jgi:hypothetical protein